MERRLINYLVFMREFVTKDHNIEETKKVYSDLMTQIAFFQHERLIHLLVTLTFALLSIAAVVACLFVQTLPLLIMTVLLICLLIPYIRHYYILENGVQELYTFYDHLFGILNK